MRVWNCELCGNERMTDDNHYCSFDKEPSLTEKIIQDLQQKIYGPRYCDKCKMVQPVRVYILNGSEGFEVKGTEATYSFNGNIVCHKCFTDLTQSVK